MPKSYPRPHRISDYEKSKRTQLREAREAARVNLTDGAERIACPARFSIPINREAA